MFVEDGKPSMIDISIIYMSLVLVFLSFFFFFSSRRRHTRWNCDWSSDVCSSDLEIKGEGNDIVSAHAKYLASHASTRIRLEGNTDARGSREYNIGLGERRAQAVRRALLLQGATESQLSTVSYGAERPAVAGNDEPAWAKNRRVEIVYLAASGQPAPVQPQR